MGMQSGIAQGGKSRLARWLAVFGPGIVVMLADTDAGSIITAAQSGAQWGYRLLLLQLVLIPILYRRAGTHRAPGHRTRSKATASGIREHVRPGVGLDLGGHPAGRGLTCGALRDGVLSGIAGGRRALYGVPRVVTQPMAAVVAHLPWC